MLELGRERRVWIDEVSRDDRSGRELRVHRLPAIKWKSADLCGDPAGTDLATCTSAFRRCSGQVGRLIRPRHWELTWRSELAE